MQTQTVHTTINLEEFLTKLFAKLISQKDQFALWRKPHSHTLNILIDQTGITKRVIPQLESLEEGFIIHPFLDQDDKKAFFLEKSVFIKINLAENQLETYPDEKILSEKFEEAKEILKNFFTEKKDKKTSHTKLTATAKEDFIELVEKGIQEIKEGKLSKIVPAKVKKLAYSDSFDLVTAIQSMLKAYPNAFINFFHLPEVGTWIGASPEVLIQTKGDQFHTMSLAGTQRARGDNPLKSVAWTQKEIEEQALVSRYIVDCFKRIRLREYEEIGPKTVIAGNLLHLKSDFKVNMKATNFPQLGSVMLELLHPTSAVCGMPRQEAFDFISKNESFDRSLFAGFIGPVNIEEETSLYVNLRTAQLLCGAALLYAGAGVTEDSDPEKEWEETELKCEIIASHLNLKELN
ncbi:chorismate-binding protein [Belliella kenyensis]|uniref:Chorismate-binding protein n=1 Tax=Belliella kenyensis TaxID=1472724 RepID=A0ABV8ENX3_9BACT|nr:chorismate-binding protein [Belliella kenyensis]MCH7403022.1 chorismate-binding protein [Belliella kenyensis]MDN3605058.1 chorismate-binding protein [Belliella kenyensis]